MPKCRISKRRIEVVVTPGGKTLIEQLSSPILNSISSKTKAIHLGQVSGQTTNRSVEIADNPSWLAISQERRGILAMIAQINSQQTGNRRNCWAMTGAARVVE
jgi:hypothetical protein